MTVKTHTRTKGKRKVNLSLDFAQKLLDNKNAFIEQAENMDVELVKEKLKELGKTV
ncbi:MAG: hypothetical protein MUD08_03310 [Cytophagales bacterium]|jgi:hypothetical protein|nr:hypothetical protein [Cytophagales bacterium]